MRWFDRSDKTARIGTLETAIARLASEVVQLKEIAKDTQEGVEKIQDALHNNHVEYTECSTAQREKWTAHTELHADLKNALAELTQIVKRNAEDIRILSANISRIADRQQRQRGE